MTPDIKEKVLKGDYRIEFLRKLLKIEGKEKAKATITLGYVHYLEEKLSLLLSSHKNFLTEVGKVIDKYKKVPLEYSKQRMLERFKIITELKKELRIK